MWTHDLADMLSNQFHTSESLVEAMNIMKEDLNISLENKSEYMDLVNAYLIYFGSPRRVIDVKHEGLRYFFQLENVGVV